jgi:hypothetical protein
MNRKPNAGPYVISFTDERGRPRSVERHTWADACAFMRECLIQGLAVTGVSFV